MEPQLYDDASDSVSEINEIARHFPPPQVERAPAVISPAFEHAVKQRRSSKESLPKVTVEEAKPCSEASQRDGGKPDKDESPTRQNVESGKTLEENPPTKWTTLSASPGVLKQRSKIPSSRLSVKSFD